MSKKAILTALGLITVGIVIGVILVSNLTSGVGLGFAGGGGDVKLGGTPPLAQQSQAVRALSDNFVAVAKAVTPSVVAVNVTTTGRERDQRMPRDFFHWFGPDGERQPSQGYGSGVIMTADGYIATNSHVVENAANDGIEVTLNDRSRHKAKLIGTDPTTDLAVIKIEGRNLPAAALGNSDNVQVGEWVLAIGNPLQLNSTVTAGIISAMGRNIDIIRATEGRSNYGIENFIQTDAAINPGNSGGALVNMAGEVIGINAAIATTNQRYQGYGFAVPVNLLKVVASDLIKFGEVRRGYLGIQIKEVDKTMADALGLGEARGVFVDNVVSGGAAASAGLQARDVILAIDGKQVDAPNELQTLIATKHPGDRVVLKLFRDGKTLEKTVTLRSREQTSETVAARQPDETEEAEAGRETGQSMKFESLGMSVRSLTGEEKRDLGLDGGVLVTEVRPYSEAYNRMVRQGEVILEADRKGIGSPAQLRKIIEGKKPGESVLLRVRVDNTTTTFLAVQIPQE